MAQVNDLITALSMLEEKHGNVEVNIYHGFDKETTGIDVSNIYYDEELKDIYIGIY